MIEIQCTSCHTRYRIDERVLPDDTPTFKCSRCGHVFTAEPVRTRRRKNEAAAESPPPRQEEAAPPEEEREEPLEKFKAMRAPDLPQAAPQAEPEPPPPPQPEAPSPAVAALQPNQPAAKKPAPANPPEQKRPATDEIFNRSFAEPQRPADAGENLKFDFGDERRDLDEETTPELPEEDQRWQVGDEPDEEAPPIRSRPTLAEPPPISPPPRPEPQRFYEPISPATTRDAAPQRPPLPNDVAFIEDPSAIHSSAWFLGMFFIVAVGFFGVTMLLNGEPAASVNAISRVPIIGEHFARPITPATLVRLGDVRTEYRTLKGGTSALVVTGNAENVGGAALQAIQIEVLLLNGSQQAVARAQTYCGNTLPAGMFEQMTPRELEFSLALRPPHNFALEPSQATPFMLVFLDPPQASSLRIAVTQADPPGTPPGAHG
ncbi:MAG TPA: zinc-ribbon domain-containing protein [Candidatus Binataceae bacterium]|nr:zinc-ribbon domain-containing protein [Candidatus Binataceae bacterium]